MSDQVRTRQRDLGEARGWSWRDSEEEGGGTGEHRIDRNEETEQADRERVRETLLTGGMKREKRQK